MALELRGEAAVDDGVAAAPLEEVRHERRRVFGDEPHARSATKGGGEEVGRRDFVRGRKPRKVVALPLALVVVVAAEREKERESKEKQIGRAHV